MRAVSSFSGPNLMRELIQRTQADLSRAQIEAGSGRLADVGLSLGAGVSRSIDLRNALSANAGYAQSNALLATRLDATSAALSHAAGLADQLRDDAITAISTGDIGALVQSASGALAGALSTFNTRIGGAFLFAGENVDTPPFSDSASAGPGRAAVQQAFAAALGVAPGSAGASAIAPAQMKNFLDTQFSALFAAPQWNNVWSQAADTPLAAEIAPGRRETASATANEAGARQTIAAAAMLTHLGLESLSAQTQRVVIDEATRRLGDAAGGMTQMQARIGIVQRDATSASDALKAQAAYLQTQIGVLENVDPAEAATRISMLTTQLETSYALTSRASRMSLVNFL